MIRLLLRLLVTKNGSTLSPLYVTRQSPAQAFNTALGYTGLLFVIHRHLNHPSNTEITKEVIRLEVAAADGHPCAYVRLLRLLVHELFNSSLYSVSDRLGRGMYATVYECTHAYSDKKLAVKRIDFPASAKDANMLSLVFTEVSVLERARGSAHVAQIVDYGLHQDSYWIVLERYDGSLRQWRRREVLASENPAAKEPVAVTGMDEIRSYLDLYKNILAGACSVQGLGVIHFDYKCDNVMIRSSDSSVYIADFGSCLVGASVRDPRGTENIQSPEVLELRSKDNTSAAERAKESTHLSHRNEEEGKNKPGKGHTVADAASDVWSLGCLLFELLTGEWLYEDEVNFPVYYQVVDEHEPVMRPKKKALLAQVPELVELLEWILVRDKTQRPTLSQLAARVSSVYTSLFGRAPGASAVAASGTSRALHAHILPRSRLLDLTPASSAQYHDTTPRRHETLAQILGPRLQVSLDAFMTDESLAFVQQELRRVGATHVLVCGGRRSASDGDDDVLRKILGREGDESGAVVDSKHWMECSAARLSVSTCREVAMWLNGVLREPHVHVCVVALGNPLAHSYKNDVHAAVSCIIATLMQLFGESYFESLQRVTTNWFAGVPDAATAHAVLNLTPGPVLADLVQRAILS
jgi:serine/threonine protein kinase